MLSPAGSAETVPASQRRTAFGQRRTRIRDHGIVLVVIALAAALSLSTDTFFTGANLANLLDQAAVPGLLACGATLCLVAGVFDLSMSAVLALSAVVCVATTGALGVPAGVLAGLAAGVLIGALNGLIIARVRVHSFIGTLALSIVHRGLALIATGGAIVYPLAGQSAAFRNLAGPLAPGNVTAAALVFLTVAAVCWLLLAGTVFGRRLYAVGGNAEAARLSGVRVGLVRTAVLALSGGCAALAGIVMAAQGGSAQAGMAPLLELTAIAAAVIGGTSVLGGDGAIWRALAGVAVLTLIGNGFNLLGWDTTYEQIVQGLLILVAVSTDHALRRPI
ncbi:monosaccharide ABC transporter membrane protein (CUT2 family) [Streptomyces sp. TLI_235]|nr:ABC transporter permease [Streptomyces sp. TLI_235]PBC69633.1 monosaccharide ABC transporter membrane protein (CUT2 family) [Streptomyces sp. TLI_235]